MSAALPLADVKVVDISTVLAGPTCARYLADFGAEVIKVEKPSGDTWRNVGWTDPRDGVSLWWKLTNRNKRTLVLDLKADDDRGLLVELCREADVLVENFRPGTLERLGLGPDVLHGVNADLVITRVTGFGQDGPYARRPGFASIAEAMSGFAAVNGQVDGPPLLPPIALTDEITGLAAAFATMVALHSGVGQVVDVNLLESLFQMMGPVMAAYQLGGYLQPRMGSGIPYTVPRGTYRTRDDKWVAVSTSAESVAARVMGILGLDADERLTSFVGRVAHRAEIDAALGAWIGERTQAEVIAVFEAAEAAIAPVYSMAELADDPHVVARQVVVDVDGVPLPGLIARLSATPGRIAWTGRPLDADGPAIRAEHGRPGPDGAEPT